MYASAKMVSRKTGVLEKGSVVYIDKIVKDGDVYRGHIYTALPGDFGWVSIMDEKDEVLLRKYTMSASLSDVPKQKTRFFGKDKDYEYLTPEEKQAIETLGWTKETWGSTSEFELQLNKDRTSLRDEQKEAAELLGYDEKDFYDLPNNMEALKQSIDGFMDTDPSNTGIIEFITRNITNNPKLTDNNRTDGRTYLFGKIIGQEDFSGLHRLF